MATDNAATWLDELALIEAVTNAEDLIPLDNCEEYTP